MHEVLKRGSVSLLTPYEAAFPFVEAASGTSIMNGLKVYRSSLDVSSP